jgi:hypothetical protein
MNSKYAKMAAGALVLMVVVDIIVHFYYPILLAGLVALLCILHFTHQPK